MKKILFVLSFLCSALMINAQVLNVSGVVSDSTGGAVSGVQIEISAPILGVATPVGYAITNANGSYFWMDTIGITPIMGVGTVDVSMIDCNGAYVTQTISYTPNLISLTANFTFCLGGSGGGGSGSCALAVSSPIISGNTVSMNLTMSGVAPYTYSWDMGDGNTYNTQNVNHTYAGSGIYNISTYSIDGTGCVDTAFTSVVIGSGGNCITAMLYYPDSMNPMTQHFFTPSAGNGPYTYFWDFGDSTTSTAATPTHTYASNGLYTVCVTVTDGSGCSVTDCQQVTIGGIWGCTVLTSHYVDTVNSMTTYFSATSSPIVGAITYFWDFGDGNTSTSQNPTHTYAQAGVYTACVVATDAAGCAATSCEIVTIGNAGNCNAYMTYYPDSLSLMTHYFNVQASGGTAPYAYVWDFDDGNTSTTQSPTHTYSQSGMYNVCVTVTDANGCTVTDCQLVFVNANVPCTTSFTASSTAANPNQFMFLPVTAATSMSYVYLWDFGDGTIDSSITPTHTYQPGMYLACLTELNLSTGCVATYCDTIVVGGNLPCQAFISYNNSIGSLVVDFFGSASPSAVTYFWDFGDSSTSTTQNPTHTYSTAATGPVTYTVTLTTTDANGCTATATETIYLFGGNSTGQIMGYMWKDTMNATPADGLVYLIEYDSIAGTLTAIDTVQTQQGFFDFQNVPMGLYMVKGALLPTDPDYANYLPTYFIQSLSWANAQHIGPAPFGIPAFIDIQLVAGVNPGGPGFIGGLVVNGAGRPVDGNHVTLIEDIHDAEPIEGASVLLLDANNNAVTHTVTAADGSYSFGNIAMGTYYVHVEEVGKITFPANITIDANNLSSTEVHFTVHENMVTVTGAYEVVNIEDFQVFPNPVYNTANVQLQLKESMDLNMTVTNMMGQVFINESLNLNAGDNSFPVEMSDLPTGIYLLSLKSGSDVITYKIQKL